MIINPSGAAVAVALNTANHIVHALVVRGILSKKQGGQLLLDIAKSTREDDMGTAGEHVATWLDEAATQYLERS